MSRQSPSDALIDSYIVPETIAKPNSFTGLMSLYESNFMRLLRLIPSLQTITGSHCSSVDGDPPLYLGVEERTRYTATLTLTYLFESGENDSASAEESNRMLADPDLRLRVYFDGRLAEVMSHTATHRHKVLRDIAASHREELDQRWMRNIMLNKWLEYLLDSKHRFE